MSDEPRPAYILLNGYGGATAHAVRIVGETPKRYRVACPGPKAVPLAGRQRSLLPGQTALVPKSAVRFSVPKGFEVCP